MFVFSLYVALSVFYERRWYFWRLAIIYLFISNMHISLLTGLYMNELFARFHGNKHHCNFANTHSDNSKPTAFDRTKIWLSSVNTGKICLYFVLQVAIIAFLCERGLILRSTGNNEIVGSGNYGNYLGILELINQFDPFLSQRMRQHANGECAHSSYLGLAGTIQNNLS